MKHAVVAVDVTPLWSSPQSPRAVDEPVTRSAPDHAAWLGAMDRAEPETPDSRWGLFDRLLTELVAGEPVTVHQVEGDWAQVVAPWQPSRADSAGYPGWVRREHLQSRPAPVGFAEASQVTVADFLAAAREHLGQQYLWGGMSPESVDCSGLVHHAARSVGLVVPRDADDQSAAMTAVDLDAVRPGDLYFFAHPGKSIHHVGIVIEPGVMIHAPSTGRQVTEEALPNPRRETLVGAGRLAAFE